MGLLMFMVALAVVPSSLRMFGVVHSPMYSVTSFLDARFHFLAGDDSDAAYVQYWFTSLLSYWTFIGIVAALVSQLVGRRQTARPKLLVASLVVAWLFLAGVLTWALLTVHSYGGHWGVLQDISSAILALSLVGIALLIANASWRRRVFA